MRTNIILKDGLTLGDKQQTAVVLREVTAGDIIEAQEESEKLVYSLDANGKVAPTLVVTTDAAPDSATSAWSAARPAGAGATPRGPTVAPPHPPISPRPS